MAKLRSERQKTASHAEVRGKSIPGRGNSWRGGPEMGTCSAHLRRPVSPACSRWQEGWNKVRLEKEYARWYRSLDFILSGMEAIGRLTRGGEIIYLIRTSLWLLYKNGSQQEQERKQWPVKRPLWQSRARGCFLGFSGGTGDGEVVNPFGLDFGYRLDRTYW